MPIKHDERSEIMKKSKIKILGIVAVFVVLIGMVGTVYANPDIEIQPSVPEGSTIIMPAGLDEDVYQVRGLAAIYKNGYGKGYNIDIVKDGATASEWRETGKLLEDDHKVEIHWKPGKQDKDYEDYTLHVKGGDDEKDWHIKTCKPSIPAPELPTSALMSVGLIALFYMASVKRKN